MDSFINSIKYGTNISINNTKYEIITKTYYSIEEDDITLYIKCRLSNEKVLVIIPNDNYIYVGSIIENMRFLRLNDNQIKYNTIIKYLLKQEKDINI